MNTLNNNLSPKDFVLWESVDNTIYDLPIDDKYKFSSQAAIQYNMLKHFWYRASGDSNIQTKNLIHINTGPYKNNLHPANKFDFSKNDGTQLKFIASEAPLLLNVDNKTASMIYWSAIISSGARIAVQVADGNKLPYQCISRKCVIETNSNKIEKMISKKQLNIPIELKDSEQIAFITIPTPRHNITYTSTSEISCDDFTVSFDSIIKKTDIFHQERWIINTKKDKYDVMRFVLLKDDSTSLWNLPEWQNENNNELPIISLIKHVTDHHLIIGTQDTPVFVNCAHGKDRTGGFIGIYEAIHRWLQYGKQNQTLSRDQISWTDIVNTLSEQVEEFAGRYIICGENAKHKYITDESYFTINHIIDKLLSAAKDLDT